MLTAAQRARLTVVLVGARNPGNIGAAARAMQDFGFTDLRVVNEFAAPFEAAHLDAKSAVGAAAVMAAAQRFDSLTDALADCTVVAGTTAIGDRELAQEVVTLQVAAPSLLDQLSLAPSDEAPPMRIALLFGSEKTGLTNEQLSYCSLLLTIPLFDPRAVPGATESTRHLSMNLGQAVAVCLYELTRDGLDLARELPQLSAAPATAGDRERLTQLLIELMQHTGYARRFPANARETVVRRLSFGLASSHAEAATWMGLFRQVLRGPAMPQPTGGSE